MLNARHANPLELRVGSLEAKFAASAARRANKWLCGQSALDGGSGILGGYGGWIVVEDARSLGYVGLWELNCKASFCFFGSICFLFSKGVGGIGSILGRAIG